VDVRRFLRRFGPAVAPGAAAAGVPADRRAELELELQPVFSALSALQATCRQIRADGEQEASRLLGEADTASSARIAEAQAQAPGARAEALRRRLELGRRQSDGTASAARREVERIGAQRERVAARLAEAVVADVRAGPARR
jgi:hypothetical protein